MAACTCLPVTGTEGKVHDKHCLLLQRRSARIIKAEVADVLAPQKETTSLSASAQASRPAGGIRK